MEIINGILFTKKAGPVMVAPEHLAVIKLNPESYLANFDMSIRNDAEINGYMFLIKGGKNDDS